MAISVIGALVWKRSRFANIKRRVSAICLGAAPKCCWKRRLRWRSPMPRRSHKSVKERPSSKAPSSIKRMARRTTASVPIHAGLVGALSGRQRRQGRYPAFIAALADGKKVQFSDFGVEAGQTGRQKIPVEDTPVKNCPSNRESRVFNA